MRNLALLLVLVGTAHGEPWSDKPAWPKATKGEVVWVLSPLLKAGENEYPKQPVALEITLGKVTRTITLAPDFGALHPYHQSVCPDDALALGRGEIAKLTFEEGGFGGYVVARSGDELSVIHWTQEDGACEDKHHDPTACPRKDKRVVRLHVPANIVLHEQIVEVDDHGARKPFDCKQ